MNIIASALDDPDFAATVVRHQPTMPQFFELALSGELPGLAGETQDRLRMREGMSVVASHPLAEKSMFVVIPTWQWDSTTEKRASSDEPFSGTFAHVRYTRDAVVIVPDDGDTKTLNIALYLQEQHDAVVKLTVVRFHPEDLSVEEAVKPCAEGYQVIGDIRRGTCVNNACPGKCRKRMRTKHGVETFKCPCS